MTYIRYATSYKHRIACGLIQDATIPASTKAYWKNISFNAYTGAEFDENTIRAELDLALTRSKKFYTLCKGLLLLYKCTNTLLSLSGKRKRLQRTAKDLIISTYDQAKLFLPVKTICKRLHIKYARISQWKKEGKCALSVIQKCPSVFPTQLTFNEQLLIRNYIFNPLWLHLPVSYIWAMAQRNGLMVAKNTFYAYAWKIAGQRKVEYLPHTRDKLIATYPFQILHMDSTIIRCTNGERVYVHFIMDNFSRAILAASASFSAKSATVAENLKRVIIDYKLEKFPFQLCSDDGPENHGDVYKITSPLRIEKIIAGYSSNTSNNMIEALNKRFKRIILRKFTPHSSLQLASLLPEMIEYNNALYMPALKTLSPIEALNGKTINEMNLADKMNAAQAERLETNRMINCKLKKCT